MNNLIIVKNKYIENIELSASIWKTTTIEGWVKPDGYTAIMTYINSSNAGIINVVTNYDDAKLYVRSYSGGATKFHLTVYRVYIKSELVQFMAE